MFDSSRGAKTQDGVHKLQLLKKRKRAEAGESNPRSPHTRLTPYRWAKPVHMEGDERIIRYISMMSFWCNVHAKYCDKNAYVINVIYCNDNLQSAQNNKTKNKYFQIDRTC